MRQEAPPPIVELRDVDKRYGDGPLILEKISFSAERGDFISLIGPSGCGKSTILKLISGLSPISGGRIVVDGMEPANAVEKLAFVFQEPTLLPWRTVAQNVEVPLRLHGSDSQAASRGRQEVPRARRPGRPDGLLPAPALRGPEDAGLDRPGAQRLAEDPPP